MKEIISASGDPIDGVAAAEHINKYFCEIGKDLADAIAPATTQFKLTTENCEFTWDHYIGEHEVLKEIEQLDISKSHRV